MTARQSPVYQWQPSTAEIAERAGIPRREVIRFDHNTSPFPSTWAGDELGEVASRLNEYPAADYRPLRHAAARYAGVGADQVVPGAGADELILLCAKAFLPRGGRAVIASPTYSLYRIATYQQGAELTDVPAAGPEFTFPAAAVAAAAGDADMVWLCVPNNPTGQRPSDTDIAEVAAAATGIVVVDAAYAEFTRDRWAPWLTRHDNMIVLHTLSKAFGLAGIRVGYSLSSPDLAGRLHAVRPPGSVSTTSAALAVHALGRPEMAASAVSAIESARTTFASRLRALGLRVVPCRTNFLLCEVGSATSRLEQSLMSEGLVVRAYRSGPLADYLRFTVRTPQEHERLLDALERNLP